MGAAAALLRGAPRGVSTDALAKLFAARPPALQIASAQQQVGTYRTELQRHDLSAAEREVVQVRVDLDPGTVAPKHRHPGEEIIYVLEGT